MGAPGDGVAWHEREPSDISNTSDVLKCDQAGRQSQDEHPLVATVVPSVVTGVGRAPKMAVVITALKAVLKGRRH
ncbi:hypothetical protein [Kineococcus sp. SYSU DK003]|uniref:hypothetical protein n=1 Tax=Kineococcus sp. SYSU DK003 TaxID=3383124 RepID=UPI003D7E1169